MKITIFLFLFLCVSLSSQDMIGESYGNDWVVRVLLLNGSEIRGVILSGRFIERPIGTSRIYEEIENIREPQAGIRIWYVRDNPGFIFLTYDEVIRVIKLGRLSDDARKLIEDRVRMKIAQAQIASEEERKRKEENLKKAGIGLTEQEEKNLLEEEARELDRKAYEKINRYEIMQMLPAEARKLLEDFPPGQGWSLELYERVKPRVNRAKIRRDFVGLPIAYRKFVDNFENWQAALDLLKSEEKKVFEKIKEEMKKEREEAKKKLEKQYQEEDAIADAMEKPKKIIQPDVVKEAPKENDKAVPQTMENTKEKKPENEIPKDIIQDNISILLYSKESKKKVEAIQQLGKLGQKASMASPSLKLCLKDSDALVRREAIQALGRIKEPKALVLNALADCLELGDLLMRREAASAFFLLGKDSATKFELIASAATLDEDPKVRYRAIRALEMIGDSRAVAQVQTRLWDPDPAVQVATASTLLTLMPNPEELYDWIADPLIKGLSNEEDQVKILASEVLKKLANRVTDIKTITNLKQILSNIAKRSKEEIRYNIQDSISSLEKKIKEAQKREKQQGREMEYKEEGNIDDEEYY